MTQNALNNSAGPSFTVVDGVTSLVINAATTTISTSAGALNLTPGGGASVVAPLLTVDNVITDGNTISTSTGDLNLLPNGASTVTAPIINIDNIQIDGNTISSTSGNIVLAPNGASVVATDNLTFDGGTVATTSGSLTLSPTNNTIVSNNFTLNNSTNLLTTTNSNGDFTITCDGTGVVRILKASSLADPTNFITLLKTAAFNNTSNIGISIQNTQGTSAESSRTAINFSGGAATDGFAIIQGSGDNFAGTNAKMRILIRSASSLTEQMRLTSTGVDIVGALSKGSGTFKIDHPLDPENKNLVHGFVESPRYDLLYRGTATLSGGSAVVDIDAASNMSPGTFAALTKNAEVMALHNKSTFDRVRGSSIVDGSFTITCSNVLSSAQVHWMVVAERNDPFIINSDPWTDETGSMVPEQDKVLWEDPSDPEVYARMEAESGPVVLEDGGIDSERVGTRGFPRHFNALGILPPMVADRLQRSAPEEGPEPIS